MKFFNKEPKEKFKGKSRSSELYITSTVSVPRDNLEKYKGLTIEDNTKFLDFIEKKLGENPDILQKKPLLKGVINFKVHKTHLNQFIELQDKLKNHNISFSSIYRYYFNEFVKHSVKES